MSISLLIGKNSQGEIQFIELKNIPILMISYCNEEQRSFIFQQFGKGVSVHKHYIITNSRFFKKWELDKNRFYHFLRDEPEIEFETRNDIINHVLEEIIKRQKIMKRKGVTAFTRYVELNTWNEIKLDYLYLFLDDVWDLIVSKPKKLALNFMMILLYGPNVGIHVVFASAISYRNLLQQLVNVYPILTIELKKKYGIPEPKKISDLGHELIFTPEEFVYYNKGNILEMVKYYKV